MELHIAITFPYYLATPGGGPHGCRQIARHLRKLGPNVTLLPVSYNPMAAGVHDQPEGTAEHESSLRADGIQIRRVAANPVHPLLNAMSVRNALKELLASQRVDVVLGWSSEMAFLQSLLKPRQVMMGMIAAASFYPVLAPRPMRNVFSEPFRMARQVVRDSPFFIRPSQAADVVFAISQFTKNGLLEMTGSDSRKIIVAHWGVDEIFFNVPRHPSASVNRFIFYGHWTRAKGVFDALRAFGHVARQGRNDWTLRIAGWGDEAAVLETAEQNGIRANIQILGKLNHGQLVRELEWSQVAVLPSHAESMGLAVAESHASGLPVVAFDVGAVPEVVNRNESGWLIPAGDHNGLANAIMQAIDNPERTFEMGLNGRKHVAGRFDWTQTARIILDGIEARLGRKEATSVAS